MRSKTLASLSHLLAFTLLCSAASFAGSSENILYSFSGGADGSWPKAGVIVGPDGALYGATQYGGANTFGTIYEVAQNSGGAWTETVIYNFQDQNDGAGPVGAIAFDANGNIFGTTAFGKPYEQGTVFKLTRGAGGSWSAQLLYAFTGGADGQNPLGGVVLDKAGNIYGTTQVGGTGCGVLFEVSANADGTWSEQTIHSFVASAQDGCNPTASLAIDAAGNLYGVAPEGGPHDSGVVFEFSPNSDGSWTEYLPYTFNGAGDGAIPSAIVLDKDANIYGTAAEGGGNHQGTNCTRAGCGTVFRLKHSSGGNWPFARIYDFPGTAGYNPNGIVFGLPGYIYGTTLEGGNSSQGTVFELAWNSTLKKWTYSLLYAFGQASGDGNGPVGLKFHKGNVFGTTLTTSGCYLCGTVWQVVP